MTPVIKFDVDNTFKSYINPRRMIPIKMTELYKVSKSNGLIITDANYRTEVIQLNETGSYLWNLADGKHNICEMAELLWKYNQRQISKQKILSDILHLFKTLENKNVLKLIAGKSNYFLQRKCADILLLTVPDPIHYLPEASGVAENSSPPLGLLYIASCLLEAGISVAVYDLNICSADLVDLEYIINTTNPKIVGISILTAVSEISKILCREIKKISSEIIIVAGGPHSSALPDHLLADNSVDVVVRGEGELTFVELAKAILAKNRFESISGISFSQGNKIIHNPDRELIDPLDGVPLPARHLIDINDYIQRAPIITSRGCKHNCIFCSSVLLRGHRYRTRSLKNVLKEINELTKPGISEIEVQDDDLSGDPVCLMNLANAFKEKAIYWACQGTISTFKEHPELVGTLSASGCKQIFFGVESGNDDILFKVKRINKKDVLNVISSVISSGMSAVASFIIGWPEDTIQTIEETLQLALTLRRMHVHTPFSILTPFPGTPIYSNPNKFGIKIENYDFTNYTYSIANISTKHLTRNQLTKAYVKVIKSLCDTFQKEGTVIK